MFRRANRYAASLNWNRNGLEWTMCGIAKKHGNQIAWLSCALILVSLVSGCSRLRFPRIDPTGQRIFLPAESTPLAPLPNTLSNPNLPANSFGAPVNPSPAFTQPPPVAPCCGGRLIQRPGRQPLLLPKAHEVKRRGPQGSIVMSPGRIIAPVGSEVVVLAGLCGDDGTFIINQPLEWMLSNDSVGQFIEVGGTDHAVANSLIKPSSKKIDGEYAWTRTSLKPRLISRGTETKTDDHRVAKGQSWLSVSSASAGTSYVTCVAPKTNAWDKRKGTTIIHWVDASWAIPAPSFAQAGQVAPLNVAVTRSGDTSGISGWKIRYQVVGGAPAEFLPDGSQTINVVTNERGQAPVQLQQPTGQVAAGTTQIRVDVIQPAAFGQRELLVESGITTVTWSAPALTIRAIGPREAGIDQPYSYRIEITNPGDQIARDVVVRTKDFSSEVKYISSNPSPSQFGNQYEWKIGDLAPRSQAKIIDIQLKSDKIGTSQLCFEVSSQTDKLQTEACAQTTIAGPCIALKLSGPSTAKIGDIVTFNIQVTNECDFTIRKAQLEIAPSVGMRAIRFGNQTIIADLPKPLEPNVPQDIPVQFQMTDAGIRCFDVKVNTNEGHSARGRKCVEVIGNNTGQVKLSLETQQVLQVGNNFQARVTIENSGTTALTNINLVNRFSDSLDLQKVSDGYRSGYVGSDFHVAIGNLNPGQKAEFVMQFNASKVDGNAFLQSSMLSAENVNDSKRSTIRIENVGGGGGGVVIPNGGGNAGANAGQAGNLTVAVRSLTPNVRRGQEAKYQVTVTNKLSTPQQSVGITMFVPPGLKFKRLEQSQRNVLEQSPDGTEVRLERIAEMRQFESYTFVMVVDALELGRPIVEVGAQSNQSNAVKGSAAIDIAQ